MHDYSYHASYGGLAITYTCICGMMVIHDATCTQHTVCIPKYSAQYGPHVLMFACSMTHCASVQHTFATIYALLWSLRLVPHNVLHPPSSNTLHEVGRVLDVIVSWTMVGGANAVAQAPQVHWPHYAHACGWCSWWVSNHKNLILQPDCQTLLSPVRVGNQCQLNYERSSHDAGIWLWN